MATAEPVGTWLLDNSIQIRPKVSRRTWTDVATPDILDLAVEMTLDGRVVTGHGWGFDRETALAKAVAEAVERTMIFEFGFSTSNGIAAHTDIDLAIDGAKNELLERDMFLCHFLTSTPFRKINSESIDLSRVQKLVRWFNERRISVSFYYLGENGVLCLISGLDAQIPFGLVLGACRHIDRDRAALNAFVESARRAVAFASVTQDIRVVSLEEFYAAPKVSIELHTRLALSTDYAKRVSFLFVEEDSPFQRNEVNAVIDVSELKSQKLASLNCPLVFARASAESVQPLFFGPTKPELVNLYRLSEFQGARIDWSSINRLPHFFD